MRKFLREIFECGCDFQRLTDKDTNKVIMDGDYYHDKIDESIDGFIDGVDYVSNDNCEVETVYKETPCPHCG